uniref:Uncharacterized protein n=1 Tax=Anguilla anguilla TaxID=7936 RepID=A0A0E9R7S6_ANGAN
MGFHTTCPKHPHEKALWYGSRFLGRLPEKSAVCLVVFANFSYNAK